MENNGPQSSSCGPDSGSTSEVPIKQQNADKQPGCGGWHRNHIHSSSSQFWGEKRQCSHRKNWAETSPVPPHVGDQPNPWAGLDFTYPTRSKSLKLYHQSQNLGIAGKTLNTEVIRRQLRIYQLSLAQAAASQFILPSLLPSTCPYTRFPHSDIPGHPAAARSLLFQHPQILTCSSAPKALVYRDLPFWI